MKIFKNPIFMFILGGIIFYSISVFAEYVVSADKVEYSSNISVKDKIDDLYTKVKPAYTGLTIITPSTTTQTLNTNSKVLNSNITINPIPNRFKELNNNTTATASDIITGKTAYDNNGNLITGTSERMLSYMEIAVAYASFTKLSDYFDYFKVIAKTSSGSCSSSQFQRQYTNGTIQDITLNTEYSISDYSYIFSKDNQGEHNCFMRVAFYNK